MHEIRSFYGIDGEHIQGYTIDGNNEILKDVGDPATNISLADRRPTGITYCNVGLVCDLTSSLFHKPIIKDGSNPKVNYSGFIKLLQTAVIIQTGSGVISALTKFHGPSDIKGMRFDEFLRDILKMTKKPSLLALDNLEPFVKIATRDYVNAKAAIKVEAVRCVLPTIYQRIHNNTCLIASTDPTVPVQSVHQVVKNNQGNVITCDVDVYNMKFQAVMWTFGAKSIWPLDTVPVFANHLGPKLNKQIKTKFTAHLSPTFWTETNSYRACQNSLLSRPKSWTG